MKSIERAFKTNTLRFFMYFYHYQEFKELNIYIDYEKYNTTDITYDSIKIYGGQYSPLSVMLNIG